MAPTPDPAPVLLVGSFPPIGGPASAASLAAVRRAWAEGDEVVTASLRPGAADLVARVAGPLAGWRLERARLAAGGPPRLVLGLEGGQLGERAARPARAGVVAGARGAVGAGVALVAVAGLVVSLDRFERVTVLVTGPLGLPWPLRRLLWRHVDEVVVEAGREELATAAGWPEGRLQIVEAYRGPSRNPGVSLLGPPEVLPRDVPLVAAGALGRRVLGPRFEPLRALVIRIARRAKRELSTLRA